MADFNPYHKWLGIPLGEQPANHYRLLGIGEFEFDADVIETAAERQTLLLRTFQTGPNAELAERLLNEVSAARVCLLDGKSKARYDQQLRSDLEPVPEDDPLAFTMEELAAVSSKPSTRQGSRQRSRGGKPFWQEPWAIPAGAGGIVVLLLLLMMLFGSGESPKGSGQEQEQELQAEIASLKEKLVAAGNSKVVSTAREAVGKTSRPFESASQAANALAAAERAIAESVVTLKGQSAGVQSVAFSPDGKWMVSGSDDKTVKVWNTRTGQVRLTLAEHMDSVLSVAVSSDSKRIASGSRDDSVKIWDAETGQVMNTFSGHKGDVKGVAFQTDGERVVSSSHDGQALFWEPDTGQVTVTYKGHSGLVLCVAISLDSVWVVTGGQDKTVKVWGTGTGREERTLEGHSQPVRSVAFSPDGKRILSGSDDETVKLWDVQSGQEIVTLRGHTERVWCVAFSPDGNLIASSSSDRTVKVWDAETGQEMLTLKGHPQPVRSVAFSPDGKRLVSGGDDGTIKVWDLGVSENTSSPTTKSLPASLQQGLIAYYPFNGNANDESGNGHHGEVHGATLAPDRSGHSEQAYQFDGKDDFISVGDHDQLDLGKETDKGLTISMWFQCDADQPSILLRKSPRNGSPFDDYCLYYASNLIEWITGDVHVSSSPGNGTNGDIAFSTKWHHLLVTYYREVEATGIKRMYFDGQTIAVSRSGTEKNESNSADLIIGSGASGEGAHHLGQIDDVRIYNRALSAAEVRQLYEFESSGTAVATASEKLYLATLRPVSVGAYRFSSNGLGYAPPKLIKVNGIPSSFGITLHPRLATAHGYARYNTPLSYQLLAGAVAIEDIVKDSTPTLTFRVTSQGKTLWESTGINKHGKAIGFCVPVAEMSQFELVSTCNSANNANAVWLDPVLLKSTGGKSLDQIAKEQQDRWLKKED